MYLLFEYSLICFCVIFISTKTIEIYLQIVYRLKMALIHLEWISYVTLVEYLLLVDFLFFFLTGTKQAIDFPSPILPRYWLPRHKRLVNNTNERGHK